MATRRGGRCLYCGRNMGESRVINPGSPRAPTRDHVFPRNGKYPLPPHAAGMNLVPCCNFCNAHKGLLHPLDYLVVAPDNSGARRLGEHLVKMGVPTADVDAALARRKKPVPVTVAPVMKHG